MIGRLEEAQAEMQAVLSPDSSNRGSAASSQHSRVIPAPITFPSSLSLSLSQGEGAATPNVNGRASMDVDVNVLVPKETGAVLRDRSEAR